MTAHHFLVGAALSLAALWPGASVQAAEQPLSAKDAASMIAVSDLAVHDGKITGTVINKSTNPVEGVRLLIRQAWFWQKESRPGPLSPGRTLTYTVQDRIPPGSSVKFSADAPPLRQPKAARSRRAPRSLASQSWSRRRPRESRTRTIDAPWPNCAGPHSAVRRQQCLPPFVTLNTTM